jgi:hypothetical protein
MKKKFFEFSVKDGASDKGFATFVVRGENESFADLSVRSFLEKIERIDLIPSLKLERELSIVGEVIYHDCEPH